MQGQNAEIQSAIDTFKKQIRRLNKNCSLLGTAEENPQLVRRLTEDFAETKDLAKRIMEDLKRVPNSSLISKLRQMFRSEMAKLQKLQPEISGLENRFMRARASIGASTDVSSPEGKAQLSQALQENQIDIQFLEYNEKEIAQRHQDIVAIEQSANEVFEMFKDVQELVDEQQEGIDQIEDNVSKARNKVEKGHQELVESERLQKKGRKRQCFLLLLVLIILAVIVILIKYA